MADDTTLFQASLCYWVGFRGITKSEVGRRVGVQSATVTRWMAGESAPGADLLESIATAFGVTAQQFLAKP